MAIGWQKPSSRAPSTQVRFLMGEVPLSTQVDRGTRLCFEVRPKRWFIAASIARIYLLLIFFIIQGSERTAKTYMVGCVRGDGVGARRVSRFFTPSDPGDLSHSTASCDLRTCRSSFRPAGCGFIPRREHEKGRFHLHRRSGKEAAGHEALTAPPPTASCRQNSPLHSTICDRFPARDVEVLGRTARGDSPGVGETRGDGLNSSRGF